MNDPFDHKIGIDLKYTPNADNVLDGTIRPDFSQIESDTAQISTNQRFALFFPEKRPFFLEGVELLSTPIQAVYTRTIAAPDWGGRATGKLGGVNYTAIVAEDSGGGSIVVPGPNASSLAAQDFHSTVFVGRAKKDFGQSFVSMLFTDRENGADGHNRVIGPDLQWRAHGTETVVAEWLISDTTTPNRPDVNAAWTGSSMKSGAGQIGWNHNTEHYDANISYKDFGAGFRADNGFVPQVGYRELFGETGWTFRPSGFISRLRTFVNVDTQDERGSGALIDHWIGPGINGDTRWNGYLQLRYQTDRIRAGGATFPRQQFQFYQRISPSKRLTQIGIDGYVGQDVDFVNVRAGRGGTINLNATVNATDHLVFDMIANTHVAPRRRRRRRQPAVVHGAGRAAARQLHLHRTKLRQADWPVRLDGSRPGTLCRFIAGARWVLQRVGALCLQGQLAVGHVLRLRRRSDARRPAAAAEVRSPNLRKALVRRSALTPRSDGHSRAGDLTRTVGLVSGSGQRVRRCFRAVAFLNRSAIPDHQIPGRGGPAPSPSSVQVVHSRVTKRGTGGSAHGERQRRRNGSQDPDGVMLQPCERNGGSACRS